MVIGWVDRQAEGDTAWRRVEAAQRDPRLPCLLIPQPAHAVLAGDLAAALLQTAFGELPPEILRAIQLHDSGWAANDAQQIQRLRDPARPGGKVVSFVAIPAAEAREAWTASIEIVEELTSVGARVVSKHFVMLAGQDPAHRTFIHAEGERRQRLENATLADGKRPTEADFDRWTAALQFCDLLSLYLLSGLTAPVKLSVAHPATPEVGAGVVLELEPGGLRLSAPILRAGSAFRVHALKHPLPAQGARVELLSWQVRELG